VRHLPDDRALGQIGGVGVPGKPAAPGGLLNIQPRNWWDESPAIPPNDSDPWRTACLLAAVILVTVGALVLGAVVMR
jgi:hypothetical protein